MDMDLPSHHDMRTDFGDHPVSNTMGIKDKVGRSMKLTIHLRLMPRYRGRGVSISTISWLSTRETALLYRLISKNEFDDDGGVIRCNKKLNR
jgi:hypothetical protein